MNTRAIGPLLAVMLLIAACGPAVGAANGDNLPPEGPRTIIVVCDGEDTCAPPEPCEVADKLREDGIDMLPEGNPDAEQTDVICPYVWLIDEVGRR